MRKLNSFILASVLILLSLSGCGMPGPLYQESDKAQSTNANIQDKQTKSTEQ
ncbi:lipoprotein [Thalassotalea sp. G2M2-11]|uniref:LPS translocon maturation chaperone LptM n=1 Tax=Thalassotalea sp. G2M2-11 TaxID=2787627 RepID=UPI0019D317AB|nr:lipoprotein [Thalassotalea sp. G2M2-11]